jgi:hypothetical protein
MAMNRSLRMIAVAASVALVAAATASAKPDGTHGHAGEHGGGKGVTYVFKGTYVDSATVEVAKGNHHVTAAGLIGTLSFDFTEAKVVVGDVNGDGVGTLDDVAAGVKVVVKVKAPRRDPGEQPFAASQIVDQTHPAESD